MSSCEYSELAEALSGLMAVAMVDEERGCGGSASTATAKFRMSIIDGQLSMTGSDDNSSPHGKTISFKGCRCVTEAFAVASSPPSDADGMTREKKIGDVEDPFVVYETQAIDPGRVEAWLESIDHGENYYLSDVDDLVVVDDRIDDRPQRMVISPSFSASSSSSSSTSSSSWKPCRYAAGKKGATIGNDGKNHVAGGEEEENDDDVVPEDFFYTTQCDDINHLRCLSLVNRWTETEFVVWDDAGDVSKLTEEELNFYRFIFVFLSAADDLVNLNLGALQSLFRQKDIHHYYAEQESIETIHSRVYSLIQLMLFNNDSMARAAYVRKSMRDPAIVEKIRWLDTKVAECISISEKYILMAIIEGIFFSSSFAAIAYLRVANLFTVTCQLNTLISRDEAVHTTASCIIYNRYLTGHAKPSVRRIHTLFKEAVRIECAFLRSRAPSNGRLLNLAAICSYVRYSADRILTQLQLPTLYDEPKPPAEFPMALMFTSDNTNFFERRNTAYSGCVTNDL